MKRGLWIMIGATVTVIAATLIYLAFREEAAEVSAWDFTKMAIVISIVWTAIGATMTIFIIMIIKKNENR